MGCARCSASTGASAVRARSWRWHRGRGSRKHGRCSSSRGRLNSPQSVQVEPGLDGTPRMVNRRVVAVVREEWRVVDRWWTDEPVQRRYLDVVLDGGERAVVYRDEGPAAGSASAGVLMVSGLCLRTPSMKAGPGRVDVRGTWRSRPRDREACDGRRGGAAKNMPGPARNGLVADGELDLAFEDVDESVWSSWTCGSTRPEPRLCSRTRAISTSSTLVPRARISRRGPSTPRPRLGPRRIACRSSSCTATQPIRSSTEPRMPEELAARAAELGYEALALTDHDGVYGVARVRARGEGVRACGRSPAQRSRCRTARTSRCSSSRRARLREPLPTADRRARGDTAAEARQNRSRRASTGTCCATAATRARLPVRLRAARARRSANPNGGRARCAVVRPRPLLRRAPAPVRARRRAAGTPRCASSRDDARGRRPSPPATSTRTTAARRASRTRSSRSAAAPRSTAASASGAATTSPSCSLPSEVVERFPTTATPSPARPSSPTGLDVRPDRRSSATATRTSPTASSRRRPAPRASATARSRSATRSVTRPQAGARRGCDEELALIAELELAGLLPAPLGGARARARGRASRCAAPARRATRCRPAAGAAARSARSSAT